MDDQQTPYRIGFTSGKTEGRRQGLLLGLLLGLVVVPGAWSVLPEHFRAQLLQSGSAGQWWD